MLSAAQFCTRPVGPLQPYAPVHTVSIPKVDHIRLGLVPTGAGYVMPVLYDVQHRLWRPAEWGLAQTHVAWCAANGYWKSGTLAEWNVVKDTIPAPREFITFEFPKLPVVPTHAQPIPKSIHHIWVGPSLPDDDLIANITTNIARSEGHITTLHTDISDELFTTLQEKLKHIRPSLIISNLREMDFFERFKSGPIYPHYTHALNGAGHNYAAAADMLRYHLVNHYGGIYMDMDDHFVNSIAGMDFRAAPNDVLLGPVIEYEPAKFSGYNNSIFASHPDNPVLTKVVEEMATRLDNKKDFFLTPKIRNPTATEHDTYAEEFFSLTSPQLFNDVLSRERPDYYEVLFGLQAENLIKNVVFDNDYVAKVLLVSEHYCPFFQRAGVEIGAAQSWNVD
ncbi:glycosyltransferase family 32 protein [Pseudomonas sp. W4I3]|uniref:glycosyltransferase family 32 protein n=1 Tax=Pseudomonas sp. W4I3 TaxID=3042294 RepID=UPI00277E49FE|nr:glycosyltransferase [Pseudomonas sp. W4I3]MDQ0739980.1 hypothetical protein [Pseudomonas sp. W4I3]